MGQTAGFWLNLKFTKSLRTRPQRALLLPAFRACILDLIDSDFYGNLELPDTQVLVKDFLLKTNLKNLQVGQTPGFDKT